MRISTNIYEMLDIKELEIPTFVGEKWMCKYYVETPAGTKIYFSNIKEKNDIHDMQFTAAAMIRDEDIYVLIPDTLGMDRGSVLIGIDVENNEVLSTSQCCLFDFYHYNQDKHQIIALARLFPEIYHIHTSLLQVNVVITSEGAIRPTGYYNVTDQYNVILETYPMYWEYTELALMNNSGSFIMHTQYTRLSDGRYYLRPATKFAISRDNIVLMNSNLKMADIWSFLHIVDLPAGVSTIWADDSVADETLDVVLANLPSTRFYNFIFIGYDYAKTSSLRLKVMCAMGKLAGTVGT